MPERMGSFPLLRKKQWLAYVCYHKGYDRNSAATNMLSIRKKGTVISFYANDQLCCARKKPVMSTAAFRTFCRHWSVQANFAEGYISDIRFEEGGPGKIM